MPYVYEVSNSKVIDASKKYPEYFKPWLSPIHRSVPNQWNTQEMIDEGYTESLFERNDIERRVFGKLTAGLSDALQWEHSKDTAILHLAIDTFEEIDSPEADAGLKRIALSDSPYIRMEAQDAIARKALKSAR